MQTNPLLSAGLWAGGRNQMTKAGEVNCQCLCTIHGVKDVKNRFGWARCHFFGVSQVQLFLRILAQVNRTLWEMLR